MITTWFSLSVSAHVCVGHLLVGGTQRGNIVLHAGVFWEVLFRGQTAKLNGQSWV